MDIAVRTASRDDLLDILRLDTWAFPMALTPEQLADRPLSVPFERMMFATEGEGGQPIGMLGSYPFETFPVPGGRIRAAGTTWVGTHPGYRRRGVLRTLMGRHLAQSRERGEAIAVLHAAEPAIYGRFGYGLASNYLDVTVSRGAQLREVPGTDDVTIELALLTTDDLPALSDVHDQVDRPGWAPRTTYEQQAWLALPHVDNPERFEPRRIVWARRDGRLTGYAVFFRKSGWTAAGPDGTCRVEEVVGLDAPTRARLWQVLLDFDLMSRTSCEFLPADDPLLDLLVNVRDAGAKVIDGEWVRVVDVPAALAGRRYPGGIDAVIAVEDATFADNAGRWRITAADGGAATVARTDAAPAITLDIRELGAIYLGSTSLARLAAAGLVTVHSPEALPGLARAFSWHQAAASSWIF